jgi:hypothetical protein
MEAKLQNEEYNNDSATVDVAVDVDVEIEIDVPTEPFIIHEEIE